MHTDRGSDPSVEVVIGLVQRGERILVQPRVGDPGLENVWELPGGKPEPGETRTSALAREIAEETGIEVTVGEFLTAHSHVYPDRRVTLYFYLCEPRGEAASRARAEWVTTAEYRTMAMPAANEPAIDAYERESDRRRVDTG